MSHIHISDGIVPPVWWLSGYLFCLAAVLIILKSYDLEKVRYKIPKIAMMAAVMLITMSVPLGFIPFHMNFAALAGIILGPAISFVSIFVVNFVLALLGHGGITVVGINTVFIGAEAVLGGVLFRLLKSKFGTTISAAISTAAALFVVNNPGIVVSKLNWSGRYMVGGRTAACARWRRKSSSRAFIFPYWQHSFNRMGAPC